MLFGSVLISLVAGPAIAGAHKPPIVPGRAFDRFIYIILENQDFTKVDQDAHWNELAPHGIVLDNFFALTHPSQPNYVATLAGDYFGLNHDNVVYIPSNISTVVDLLEARNVSWGAYMEDIPSPGYLGAYSDGSTGAGWDYVRKHKYETDSWVLVR
jgi:acid phosphatase